MGWLITLGRIGICICQGSPEKYNKQEIQRVIQYRYRYVDLLQAQAHMIRRQMLSHLQAGEPGEPAAQFGLGPKASDSWADSVCSHLSPKAQELGTNVQGQEKTDVPTQTKIVNSLFLHLFFCSDLQCPPTLVRSVFFIVSMILNANLFQKHPETLSSYLGLPQPRQVTHTINHHNSF